MIKQCIFRVPPEHMTVLMFDKAGFVLMQRIKSLPVLSIFWTFIYGAWP